MSSYIRPQMLEPAAPPWNWNPGATFVEAFNASQENRRRNEEMAMEQELNKILFPLKQQQAALQLEKLQQEVERSTIATQKLREWNSNRHSAGVNILRGIPTSGIGAQESKTQANPFMIDTTGFDLKTATSRTPSSPRTVVLPTQ